MCDYCDPFEVAKYEHEPIFCEGEAEELPEAHIAISWKNWLCVTIGWYEIHAPIKFCPMCGRELNDDV